MEGYEPSNMGSNVFLVRQQQCNLACSLMVAMCSIHNGRVRDTEELRQARGPQSVCSMTVWFLDVELEAVDICLTLVDLL